MAKKKRTRKVYSEKQRSAILAAAKKEGLTATAVQKRFGVTPVTYYSWRRKAGVGKRRKSVAGPRGASDGLLKSQLRTQLNARLGKLFPGLLRSEVSAYLDAALGIKRRRRTGA